MFDITLKSLNIKYLYKSLLLRDISIYTFFRLINRSLPILLLPFLTHYLKPSDYAIIDFFTNFTYILIPLIGFNTVSSLSRYYYDKEINYVYFSTTVIKFSFITFFIFSILSILFNSYIFDIVGIKPIPLFVFFALIYSFFEQIFLVHTTNLRLQGKSFSYGIIGLLRTLIELVASLVFIYFFYRSWHGRIYGQFLGLLIVTLISIRALFLQGMNSLSFNISYIKIALTFSFPLLIHTIAGILLGFLNRFFIISELGVTEAGIFASAYQLCFIVSLFHTSFNEAWVPYLFSTLSNSESIQNKIRLMRITYLYFLFLILITLGFILFIPFIYKIIGKDFQVSYSITILISIGFLFNGFYKMIVNYLFYIKKTKIIAYGTLLALIINTILNYFLIDKFKLIGASMALTLTFFLHFIIFLYFLHKYYPMPWNIFQKTPKL